MICSNLDQWQETNDHTLLPLIVASGISGFSVKKVCGDGAADPIILHCQADEASVAATINNRCYSHGSSLRSRYQHKLLAEER
ncbi:hypothetical protein GS399_20415 [Pedobacter sp. HMF7647]|uniref:Uncharacterized protein n=1 Tax=Hufsiella arboris TaxID=2695275 RepID=A0A7K1YFW8_9SPHI|nr:hypothetical protein [Hufsiella arboris]MXV53331.1 hypothetical protein [Hufsiella arboris]